MNNVFDNELVSRQYKVAIGVKNALLEIKKGMINIYLALLSKAIEDDDSETVHSILEDMFLERISNSKVDIWINRINNGETTLQRFKELYLKMADWGFSPYHS